MGFLFNYIRVHFRALTIACAAFFSPWLFARIMPDEPLSLAWQVEPFYLYRHDGKPGRAITLMVNGLSCQGPVTVKVVCNSITETTVFGRTDRSDHLSVLLPAGAGVDKATIAGITVLAGGKELSENIPVPPGKQWTVYIYPHSHVDIGYTALPRDVERLQVRNMDVGIDLAKKTQHYPEGSRFIWNPEATWVVMKYLEQATPQQKQGFIEAVKKGWVQIDGGHSNLNTSTCSDEELLHFFANAAAIEKITGRPVTTMVQMDVPGAAWGLIQAASAYGINGMISFPNYFDMRKQWEARPFYWLAPDGKTKILFLQGFPYGIGYTLKGRRYGLGKLQTFSNNYDRVTTPAPLENFLDPFIFEETAKLESAGLPYDLFVMTWSMADNCVIDADLPQAVRQWNERYAYPKLVISGAKGILDAFEKKYASAIPTFSGDFTEFWTNGLGSDAASVGEGRKGKENLVQAETLWSMLAEKKYPAEKFRQGWEAALLSAEHTWGAQDSKSRLAQQVEKIKASYFTDSEKESGALIGEALSSFKDTTASSFSVINTLSWERNGIVTLTKEQSKAGDRVIDETDRLVPSQRLVTGELIFQAQQIPALGSRLYKVVAGQPEQETDLSFTTTSLSNSRISVRINPRTGTVSSVKELSNGYEYADSAIGINGYQYLTGVYNGKDFPGTPTTDHNVALAIKEKGPLLVSFLVTSNGEGVKSLTREVLLYRHSESVELRNRLDKVATLNKEGVHFGFGFHLPNGTGRMDMPWSIVTPDKDQLKGSNKNWFAVQRWVDISNKDRGVTWSALEAPLIEWGRLSGNILDGARQPWLWQKEVRQSSIFYSWPLNNHWDTNFPLEQSGIIWLHYAFMVHGSYDRTEANQFGMEQHRPLIVVQTKKNVISRPLIHIANSRLVLSAVKKIGDPKTYLFRVRSISEMPEQLTLSWPSKKPREIFEISIQQERKKKIGNTMAIPPYGMANLEVVY